MPLRNPGDLCLTEHVFLATGSFAFGVGVHVAHAAAEHHHTGMLLGDLLAFAGAAVVGRTLWEPANNLVEPEQAPASHDEAVEWIYYDGLCIPQEPYGGPVAPAEDLR